MSPRYFNGEIIGIHADVDLDRPVEQMLGREVVARLSDGRMLLKIIQAGRIENLFSLVSLNPRVPPIIDAEVEWAREIELRLPAKVRRSIFRSS